MFVNARRTSIIRSSYLAALLLTSACSDGGTNPAPAASVRIAPPSAQVYEGDAVHFQAEFRDAAGRVVDGAPITWSVSDTLRAELGTNGIVTALKPGTVRITARSGSRATSYDLSIAALTVQRVLVLPSTLQIARGDVTPIGVKVEGQGARHVSGRVVTLASDNPTVATVDADGRIRGVQPGVATIRATADGVTGTGRVEVTAENALLNLSRVGGLTLPRLIDADTVSWDGVKEYHEVYMESGDLTLSGSTQPRYEVSIRYAEYNAVTVNGRRELHLRRTSREYDRGVVQYDARGDLLMTSEYISPLSHTASAAVGGFQMRFRIPGTDSILDLFFRREPK